MFNILVVKNYKFQFSQIGWSCCYFGTK